MTVQGSALNVGDDVYGEDGDKLGAVSAVHDNYIVVEKGFFFPTDHYIPANAISRVDHGKIYLTVSKDNALQYGWDSPPAGGMQYDETTMADASATMPAAPAGADLPQAGYEVAAEDDLLIPVMEEELSATVRSQETGAVRIEKRVISEDRVLEVPVTDEQIRVERRVVNRDAMAADANAFEDIVIEVPLTSETVELHKDARVTGEVLVSKEAVEHTERVTGTVRREEVVVDESGIAADQRSVAR
jgi:uncharacterized protein (TIGR02271 family)